MNSSSELAGLAPRGELTPCGMPASVGIGIERLSKPGGELAGAGVDVLTAGAGRVSTGAVVTAALEPLGPLRPAELLMPVAGHVTRFDFHGSPPCSCMGSLTCSGGGGGAGNGIGTGSDFLPLVEQAPDDDASPDAEGGEGKPALLEARHVGDVLGDLAPALRPLGRRSAATSACR